MQGSHTIPYSYKHTHTNIHLVSCIRNCRLVSRHDSWASESNEQRHDSVPRSLGPHDYRAPTDLKDYQQYLVLSVAKTH
jgi:hypothetical protein